MFNNTSKIMFTFEKGFTAGVILPTSDHLLTTRELDQKIKKAKSHIDHLSHQTSHRNTHGGKSFRSRQISLKDQLFSTSDRLERLQAMKGIIVRVQHSSDRLESFGCTPSVPSPIYGRGEADFSPYIKELEETVKQESLKLVRSRYAHLVEPAPKWQVLLPDHKVEDIGKAVKTELEDYTEGNLSPSYQLSLPSRVHLVASRVFGFPVSSIGSADDLLTRIEKDPTAHSSVVSLSGDLVTEVETKLRELRSKSAIQKSLVKVFNEDFSIEFIAGDGNCLFTAFRKGLNLAETTDELRELVAQKLVAMRDDPDKQNWVDAVVELTKELFSEVKDYPPDILFGVYLEYIKGDKNWGSFLDLQILSLIYPVKINIWHPNSPDSKVLQLAASENTSDADRVLDLYWTFRKDHYHLLHQR